MSAEKTNDRLEYERRVHAEMLDSFRMVQDRGRCLLIRGKLDRDDLALLRRSLSPDGLYLQIVAQTNAEARQLGEFFAPWR